MPLRNLINVRKLCFHSHVALGHEDTCTLWTLYSCSAFGSKPEKDRFMPRPELPSLTSVKDKGGSGLPSSPSQPFLPLPRGCGL